MSKLEQMQERARELRPKLLPTKDEMGIYERKMLSLITEVWNEAIKEEREYIISKADECPFGYDYHHESLKDWLNELPRADITSDK